MVKVPSIKVQIRGGVRDDPGHSLNILTYDTLRPYGGVLKFLKNIEFYWNKFKCFGILEFYKVVLKSVELYCVQ